MTEHEWVAADLEELAHLRMLVHDGRLDHDRLIEQERAVERERCLAIVEEHDSHPPTHEEIAEAIRALGPAPFPEAWRDVVAERDRYKAALEEVVEAHRGSRPDWAWLADRMLSIAREALGQE